MRVLLIWEEISEKTTLYLIEDITDEELSVLEKANGKYANSVDDEYAFIVHDWIIDRDEWCRVPGDKNNCKWKNKDVESPVNGPIDKVFVSGINA